VPLAEVPQYRRSPRTLKRLELSYSAFASELRADGRVVDIVRRSLDHFPSGTLAALKNYSPTPASRPQSDSVSTAQAPRQSSNPQSGKERGSIGNPFGITLDHSC
jgi:hypothetical protein